MMRHRCLHPAAAAWIALAVLPVCAAPSGAGATIELSAEARRNAANDLIRASVFSEASGATPRELAKRVNQQMVQALELAHAYSRVRTRTGGTRTEPIYGKSAKIEAWRMRSELLLESGDAEALSELLSKLQMSMSVGNLVSTPTVETRRKAENEAIVEAIAAFRARAETIAGALGKPYRIRRLTINGSSLPPSEPVTMRSSAVGAAVEALPIEAGAAEVSATISGQIELLE